MVENFPRKFFISGFFVLVCVLGYFQLIRGEYYLQRSRDNYVRLIPISASRGRILDRGGTVLAYDRPSFNIAVIPYQIKNKRLRLFEELAAFCGLDPRYLAARFARGKHNLFSPVAVITGVDKGMAIRLKERFGQLLIVDARPQRYYPYGAELSHELGYVRDSSSIPQQLKSYGYAGTRLAGFSGIEQQYDPYLAGEDGGYLIEVDSRGKTVGYLGENSAKPGQDLSITIDYRAQNAAYQAMEGRSGVLLLMDTSNGEILAMLSQPSYDPNEVIKGKNIAAIFSDPAKPLLNRAIQSLYPIGSTFKPFTALAALHSGAITPATTFTCTGVYHLGRAAFKCWSVHGLQDMYDALAHSCNYYFYNVGALTGPDAMYQWAENFGLDSLTGIDIPYEKCPVLPNPSWKQHVLGAQWQAGDTINMSIGQGYVNITPIALLVAVNAIANGGYLVRPHLLKAVNGVESGTDSRTFTKVRPQYLREVQEGMIAVVERDNGTAHLLNDLTLKIAGKTGTAQNSKRPHGWFIGYFPHDAPRYSICVLMEYAGTGYEAVKVAHAFLGKLKATGVIGADYSWEPPKAPGAQ